MPVEQQRFWKWSQRQNGTYRPASVLKPEGPDTPISVRAAARHGRVLGVCERQRGGPTANVQPGRVAPPLLPLFPTPVPADRRVPLLSLRAPLQSIKETAVNRNMRPGVMATLNLFLETPDAATGQLPPLRPNLDLMLFFKQYCPTGGAGAPGYRCRVWACMGLCGTAAFVACCWADMSPGRPRRITCSFLSF